MAARAAWRGSVHRAVALRGERNRGELSETEEVDEHVGRDHNGPGRDGGKGHTPPPADQEHDDEQTQSDEWRKSRGRSTRQGEGSRGGHRDHAPVRRRVPPPEEQVEPDERRGRTPQFGLVVDGSPRRQEEHRRGECRARGEHPDDGRSFTVGAGRPTSAPRQTACGGAEHGDRHEHAENGEPTISGIGHRGDGETEHRRPEPEVEMRSPVDVEALDERHVGRHVEAPREQRVGLSVVEVGGEGSRVEQSPGLSGRRQQPEQPDGDSRPEPDRPALTGGPGHAARDTARGFGRARFGQAHGIVHGPDASAPSGDGGGWIHRTRIVRSQGRWDEGPPVPYDEDEGAASGDPGRRDGAKVPGRAPRAHPGTPPVPPIRR